MTHGRLENAVRTTITCFEHGDWVAMVEQARQGLALMPNAGKLWHLLGVGYLQQQRLTEAKEALTRACELSENDAEMWDHLGLVLSGLRVFEEAGQAFTRSLQLAPQRADTWGNAAHNANEAGDYAQGVECAHRALALSPQHLGGLVNLGNALQELGQPEEALLCHQQALAINPRLVQAWHNQGVTLQNLHRHAEAERSYREALALNPIYVEVHNNLGLLLTEQERFSEAEACYRQALNIRPTFAVALNNLGIVLREQQKLFESEDSYRRALAIKPDYAEARNNLGIVLHAQGRFEDAIAAFRSGIALLIQDSLRLTRPARPRGAMDVAMAHTALFDIKAALDDDGVPFFLAYGTLLGIVRDGDLLPHDKDMDLGLPWDMPREGLIARLARHGFFEPKSQRQTAEDRKWCISLVHQKTGIVIDLFFFKPDGASLLSGFNRTPVPLLWRFDAFDQEALLWQGAHWNVPSPAAGFLENIYGPEWTIPDPYFDSVVSGKNRTPESIGVALCYGYNRLLERMSRQEWKKAAGYCRQLQAQKPDPFIGEAAKWIETRISEQEVNGE